MRVLIDCENLKERKQAHRYLAKLLSFPDYYGKNLDALFDCLTELNDCTIVLNGSAALLEAGGYGAKILKVLEEAARENRGLILEYSEEQV